MRRSHFLGCYLVTLILLSGACGGLSRQAATISSSASPTQNTTEELLPQTIQTRLIEFIRPQLTPRPDATQPAVNPCLPDFDPGLVDAHNEHVVRTLAALLALPEAQSVSAADLRAAFNDVSQSQVHALVEGDGYFLAAISAWTPQCAPGRHMSSRLMLSVINRHGAVSPLEILYGNDGWGAFIEPQWAGDRWLAVVNNNGVTLCRYCYSIWEIKKAGEGWTHTTLLELGTAMDYDNQWVSSPQLTLLDSYRRIALDLSPDYIDPPCQFTPSIQPELYKIWRDIRREYIWQPQGYQQTAETEIATHVIINVIDELGRRTYRRLEDWQAYCIQPSR